MEKYTIFHYECLIWSKIKGIVPNFCRNDGCLLKNSKLFILFAENSQILFKISVIPILLTFIYLVAPNLIVNNQLN